MFEALTEVLSRYCAAIKDTMKDIHKQYKEMITVIQYMWCIATRQEATTFIDHDFGNKTNDS